MCAIFAHLCCLKRKKLTVYFLFFTKIFRVMIYLSMLENAHSFLLPEYKLETSCESESSLLILDRFSNGRKNRI